MQCTALIEAARLKALTEVIIKANVALCINGLVFVCHCQVKRPIPCQ